MKSKKFFLILVGIILFLIALIFFSLSRKADVPIDGFKPPTESPNNESQKCGMENCHGLDIICGPNIPEVCTEIYQIGDSCRRYAKCRIQNGECKLIKSDSFDKCKSCVENCLKSAKNNSFESFDCENKCHLEINDTDKPVPM